MVKQLFLKTKLFKEWRKIFVALLTKENGKMAMNEWENDDPVIFRASYSV